MATVDLTLSSSALCGHEIISYFQVEINTPAALLQIVERQRVKANDIALRIGNRFQTKKQPHLAIVALVLANLGPKAIAIATDSRKKLEQAPRERLHGDDHNPPLLSLRMKPSFRHAPAVPARRAIFEQIDHVPGRQFALHYPIRRLRTRRLVE